MTEEEGGEGRGKEEPEEGEEGGVRRGKEQKGVKRRSLERDIVQEAVIKTIPPQKMQKGKMTVWGALQIAEKRKETKSTGEKERLRRGGKNTQKYYSK